jgi:hypothetical protein
MTIIKLLILKWQRFNLTVNFVHMSISNVEFTMMERAMNIRRIRLTKKIKTMNKVLFLAALVFVSSTAFGQKHVRPTDTLAVWMLVGDTLGIWEGLDAKRLFR